ncbi:flagellin [Jannaschia sp. LMIT008]|uniref:flagellin N-terminal helical domain-containing protein n=1 Tax=Jannaschia maritima TaxID=3032585 RepID=UPI002810FA80|nr:flagellin [Jannaschia sp. LMIT008]
MSSILTNNSAMVALQTLQNINKNLGMTQGEISTGKSIANAKDNSAVWAISKTMESDVAGFKAIQDSLNLGDSTVAVARTASERVTDLLTEIKGKVVASQEENVDRGKIKADIDELVNQIKSTVGAAQFNGLNLVKGSEDVEILSSLDRSSSGVAASNISVSRQDLTTDAGNRGTTALSGVTVADYGTITDSQGAAVTTTTAATGKDMDITIGGTIAVGDTLSLDINGNSLSFTATTTNAADVADALKGQINALGLEGVTADNTGGVLTISNTNAYESVDVANLAETGAASTIAVTEVNGNTSPPSATSGTIEQRAETIDLSSTTALSEGDTFSVTVGGDSFFYVAGKSESMEDVAKGLATAINTSDTDGVEARATQADDGTWSLAVDDDTGGQAFGLQVTTGGDATGGLFGLDNLNVDSNENASKALDTIETLISNSIDAAASLGSAQGRIEKQNDFMGNLIDNFTSGIGSLVDANMEEASARLQALQVQQQLATQSLSIANQAPQSILALFR